MSSRAIRKLQRLREQESQQASAQEEDESSEEEPVIQPSKPKLNAFDLLSAADEEDEDSGDIVDDAHETQIQPSEPIPQPPTQASSSKKKKKKKKNKNSSKPVVPSEAIGAKVDEAELDEIDRALKELSANESPSQAAESPAATMNTRDPSFQKSPEELLAIEPKFLNATNEMRKLFGNVVLETFDQSEDANTGRRRDRRGEMFDLGRALTGRYSPASRGQSLAGVTLRKNALMAGKDEWPRAPSGGLGMEVEERFPNGNTVYRILHNTAYMDVQRQFEMCVESMDPQRLIHLLQYNPYHISTLLQVSEIAKHQGDHAVSADLLERALFNIGRSAHSSFGNKLKEGQAQLNFIHAENRELWLVGWRYIANLGMKGTWRTAYEWAKLLLSLDTADPYCIKLLIDHLALRGREYAHFVELCTQTRFSRDWTSFPNIQCSLALAYLRLNKPKECRECLDLAMRRYPWLFCRLAQELDISPMPKQIWGKMPPTDAHELFTELYIARAKDLWNTPEVVSLIVEVANTLIAKEEQIEPPEITLDIARHVVLSDIPKVTTHLPGRFISGRISASDPLPPYDSEAYREQSNPVPSYLSRLPIGQPQWLRDILGQMMPAGPSADDNEERDGNAPGERAVERDPSASPAPEPDRQTLEQWLLGDGLQALQAFLGQNGVDRGNWGDDVDLTPLTDYVSILSTILPDSSRQSLLNGAIRDAVGDIVVNVLEEELMLLEYHTDDDDTHPV